MVVACAVTFVLIVLAVMLFIELPLWAVRSIGVVVIGIFVISLLLLGVDIKKQIQLVKRVENCWNYSCFKKFFFYILSYSYVIGAIIYLLNEVFVTLIV